MRRIRLSGCTFGLLAVVALVLAAAPRAQAVTVVVDPSNLQGWAEATEAGQPAPNYGFVTGPGTPALGVGSLHVKIDSSGSKFYLGRGDLSGVSVGSLTALSFYTYVDPSATKLTDFYINLYLGTPGQAGYAARLDFVPGTATDPVVKGQWQLWDALNPVDGKWYLKQGSTYAQTSLAAKASSTIINPWSGAGPGIVFVMGDTASNYVGFSGSLDGITIGTANGSTTYDLEPQTESQPAAAPEPVTAGLTALSLLTLALGATRRRQTV